MMFFGSDYPEKCDNKHETNHNCESFETLIDFLDCIILDFTSCQFLII